MFLFCFKCLKLIPFIGCILICTLLYFQLKNKKKQAAQNHIVGDQLHQKQNARTHPTEAHRGTHPLAQDYATSEEILAVVTTLIDDVISEKFGYEREAFWGDLDCKQPSTKSSRNGHQEELQVYGCLAFEEPQGGGYLM